MAKKKTEKEECKSKCCKSMNCNTGGGCLYFMGFLGTAVYYIQTSTGFWNDAWGVAKALVWPAILAWKLMGL